VRACANRRPVRADSHNGKRIPDQGTARPPDTRPGGGRAEAGERALSNRKAAPAEILFDTGIGDTFNARIAGNVVNDDLLGSLEFACAVSGAKVILLFGHTACGAIKGAIDDVEMGNLTGLLARVKPAITATAFTGEKSSKNAAYVDAVARTNVRLGLDSLRRRSPILEDLERKKSIQLVGGMYDLATGIVEFV
jgi:carbonic anhydrase